MKEENDVHEQICVLQRYIERRILSCLLGLDLQSCQPSLGDSKVMQSVVVMLQVYGKFSLFLNHVGPKGPCQKIEKKPGPVQC